MADSSKLPEPEFFKDDAGEYRFRLKAANGEILLTSEGYTRRKDAERGLDDLRRNFPRTEGET